MSNIVAIVGRPNVGKSTLYNRLIGERRAIIDDISGVTRDRQYGLCEWNGRTFSVVDTGGFVKNSEDIFEAAIRNQVMIAMDEATVILFMVDVTTGVTDLDEEVARMLRKTDKHVILVVNKVENFEREMQANEFWSLGFEQTLFLSSMTGSGTGEVLDLVTERLNDEELEDVNCPKFAVVGQPNAGKSSFINALLGEDRNIVTEIAGTTRDSVHSKYNKYGKEFLLIDTAGLRKKSRVHENLEYYSVMRAIKAIDDADVCLLVIDATQETVESQDMSIFRLAQRRNKGIVILVNKWDLIEGKETNTVRDFENMIKEKIAPFSDVPIIFISALNKQRIFRAIETATQVYESRSTRISTSKLNVWLEESLERHSPASFRGQLVQIKYVTQLPTYYPAFAFFCNNPKYVKDDYKLYLENRLRAQFPLSGVPISLFFRKK